MLIIYFGKEDVFNTLENYILKILEFMKNKLSDIIFIY